jgi:hypothetical protein
MKFLFYLTFILTITLSTQAQAELLFFDDFEDGARPEWGNEYGDWVASAGVYSSTIQSNIPPTYSSVSSLPELVDFVVELDVNGVRDGGVYLRSHYCESGLVDGVILVIGGYSGTFNGFYWHVCYCDGWSEPLNQVDVPGLQGSDIHLRIVVAGNDYLAFLNDQTTPITTLTTDACASGRVGLYEYLDQSFDNVLIKDAVIGVNDGIQAISSKILSVSPNPFNPRTTFTFNLDQCQNVEISIYNLMGNQVLVLTDQIYSMGRHSVVWNGRDSRNRVAPSGTYLVRFAMEHQTHTTKVALVR